jgi:hypothetical protein
VSDRTRSLAATAGVIVFVTVVALLKSGADPREAAEAGTADAAVSLESTYHALAEQETALAIGFYLEGYICCEGARIMYEQMLASVTDVLARAKELEVATLLIDMSDLSANDRTFAFELADRLGIRGFNGVALLTPSREIHSAILGPHYFLPRMIASVEELAGQ